MSSLLVVTGPPGAGKSTVAQILAGQLPRSVLMEGDAFFRFVVRGGVAPWLSAAHSQNEVVTKAAAAAAGRYVDGGYVTVYDGVVGPWLIDTFVAATGLAGIDYVVLLPSAEDCLHRVRTRRGHGFADEGATRHMHAAFERATIGTRHVLRDPPDRPDDLAALILAARGVGSLAYGRGS